MLIKTDILDFPPLENPTSQRSKGDFSMERLRDDALVWRFQKYFGIKKVSVVRDGEEEDTWTAKEASTMPDLINLEDSEESEEEEGLRKRGTANGEVKTPVSSAIKTNIVYYKIRDQFWYLLFRLGSELGGEELLGLYLSVWMWCLDSHVGRRVVLMWTLVMYLGQGLKDVIRWPRPKMPQVIQLEQKWALEYGMPSTHAMVGLAVPVGSIVFTMARYDYPLLPWVLVAMSWCSLVCCSRLYLGMHSVADVAAGLLLTPPLLLILLPLIEASDHWLMTSSWAPAFSLSLSFMAVWYYPGSDRWTPARGDTTASIGTYIGVLLGHWVTAHTGLMCTRPGETPFPIHWLTLARAGTMLARMFIGFLVFLVTRAGVKPLSFAAACAMLQQDPEKLKVQERDVGNKDKLTAELTQKFVTYLACGCNAVLLCPALFWVLGCGKPNCWTDW